jgi:predicted O-methyltransferase YrrM
MYTHDWFSNNIGYWTQLLSDLKGKPDLNFLEIGCYEGKATYWLCKNILTDPTSTITVVDTFAGSKEHEGRVDFSQVEQNFRENLAEFIPEKVNIFRQKSQDYLRDINACIYNFIYIDGSHTAPDVLEDAVLAWRLLKPEGIMVFDDYAWDAYKDKPELNPRLAIDSFLSVMTGKYQLLQKSYQVAVKKCKLE